MKIITKTALIVVSLLLSAGPGFAADVKAAATAAESAVKSDVKSAAAGKTAEGSTAAKAALIDINSATAAELKAIPGVGDAFAAKIIAGRPFANKSQLTSRKIIPVPLYEQIKDRIIAKQPAKNEKAPAAPAGKK